MPYLIFLPAFCPQMDVMRPFFPLPSSSRGWRSKIQRRYLFPQVWPFMKRCFQRIYPPPKILITALSDGAGIFEKKLRRVSNMLRNVLSWLTLRAWKFTQDCRKHEKKGVFFFCTGWTGGVQARYTRSAMPPGSRFTHCRRQVTMPYRQSCCQRCPQRRHFLPTGPLMRQGYSIIWRSGAVQPVFLPGNTQESRSILKGNTVGGVTRQRTRFACLKDWRRIVLRQDCCAHTFFSTIPRLPLVSSSLMRPDTKDCWRYTYFLWTVISYRWCWSAVLSVCWAYLMYTDIVHHVVLYP